jgi:glycosyltransferase involved in cell wall biosynthesis
MLDLVAEYVPVTDVSVMMRPTTGGQRLLARAAALGARTVPLPSPRDRAFAQVVTGFLAEHPAQVFHCHVGTGCENWDGVRLARTAGCPAIVQTQHLPYRVSHPRKRRAYHHGIEEVDGLIAVSEGVRRTYLQIGVPPERITTVANGIAAPSAPLSRERARAALALGADDPVVLTLGRLTHMKEQWHLIDAVPLLAPRFPGLAVVLVGDGPLRAALVDRAAGLGIPGVVRFAGHRPEGQALLAAADVFVLPSRYEGMPLAALEAMAAGLPVVATRVIGSEEVVADGVSGALVPRGSPSALASAIAGLLADPALRRRQGDAGRRRQQLHFTRGRMAADTLAVYERALRTNRPVLQGLER